jgi:hypothetical protein
VKIHEVRVREHTFYIRRFDPFVGAEILGDLQKDWGGPLLAGAGKGTNGNPIATLLSGLADLSSNMDGKKFRAWLDRLLLTHDVVTVSISGGDAKRLARNDILANDFSVAELFDLCVESVKFNFEDFPERWRDPISSALSQMVASQLGSSAQN